MHVRYSVSVLQRYHNRIPHDQVLVQVGHQLFNICGFIVLIIKVIVDAASLLQQSGFFQIFKWNINRWSHRSGQSGPTRCFCYFLQSRSSDHRPGLNHQPWLDTEASMFCRLTLLYFCGNHDQPLRDLFPTIHNKDSRPLMHESAPIWSSTFWEINH